VIACEGYSTKTVGEDMELVVRMRRYMATQKKPYQVVYIPDPLAWTEVPDTSKILANQRNRWTRGTLETLIMHRKLFLNLKYGKFSMLGYTYWLFFEWLAPIVEFLGYLWFIYLVVTNQVNWPFFLHLFAFVYSFAVMISTFAVLFEEKTFHKYKKRSDVFRLILTAVIEPIWYHPRTVWWAIRGNIDYLRGIRSWGKMERVGFGVDQKVTGKKRVKQRRADTVIEMKAENANTQQ
jgi:cellulose synthase/poly-beta-1,6-N-acetylglucosamine synthase-like glycosyltransferase